MYKRTGKIARFHGISRKTAHFTPTWHVLIVISDNFTVYLHSFSRCCLPNLQNTRNSEKIYS